MDKLNLTAERDLIVFHSLIIPMEGGENKSEFILAFAGEDVMNDLKVKYKDTKSIISLMGQIPMKRLLDCVTLGTQPEAITIPSPATQTKEAFIHNVLLVADRFVENEKDKASLKRILSRVK